MTVRAGGQQQRFSYRVAAVPADTTKTRVLVVAAEDYTGTSPNRTPGYATAPRHLQQHVDALTAAGYDVATFNVDAPPANATGQPGLKYPTFNVDAPPANATGQPGLKYPTFLGVLSHFDAVDYYTGDDYVPQDAAETTPRHLSSATAFSGSTTVSQWAAKGWFNLRDYLNEGGKAVLDGHGVHPPAQHQQRHRAVLLRRRLARRRVRLDDVQRRPRRPGRHRHLRRAGAVRGRHRGRRRPQPGRHRRSRAAGEVGHPPAHALERDLAAAAAPGARRARRADDAGPVGQRRRGDLHA